MSRLPLWCDGQHVDADEPACCLGQMSARAVESGARLVSGMPWLELDDETRANAVAATERAVHGYLAAMCEEGAGHQPVWRAAEVLPYSEQWELLRQL